MRLSEELRQRTKRFASAVIRLYVKLPRRRPEVDVLARQLLRSGTSVGANYRAACRGRSSADVVATLSIVEEEADESIYWMELLVEGAIVKQSRVEAMKKEANELLAMTVASIKTLRARNRQ